MLIVTNGDSAAGALREAGFEQPVLAWADVLHEGPVPGGLSLSELSDLRARYLSGQGWGSLRQNRALLRRRDRRVESLGAGEEVLLWFEHDLYDQLQLLQLLDLFARRPRSRRPGLWMICKDRFVAQLDSGEMWECFQHRQRVKRSQLELGMKAWAAFRQDRPVALNELARAEYGELPYLAAALRRLIEEYPDRSGLSRTRRQALEAVEATGGEPVEVFRRSQACEEAAFLGDTTFWSVLEEMSAARRPLLETVEGRRFRAPGWGSRPARDSLRLTADGGRVLRDEADLVRLNGIDRWLGGVHLLEGSLWRRREDGTLYLEDSGR